MLNKFLIPAALVATVVIAGIFAFMPVEKAATVHGSIDSNVDAEVDAQDRFLVFEKNYTLAEVMSMPSRTIVRVDSGTTNGIVVIAASRNIATPAAANGGGGTLECGAGISADGADLSSGGNATSVAGGVAAVVNGTFSITNGDDILFGPDADTSTIGGVCRIYIQFDNTDG